MDYSAQSLGFQIRKAARYVALYGPRRTLVKVQAQRHMSKVYAGLPETLSRRSTGHVGIIGCGKFAYGNIAYYLHKNYGQVIRAAMDIDINKAASLFDKYGLSYYTDEAAKVLEDPEIDLLFIASNHASHAEYAIEALRLGKCVHIEKPHVVTERQLTRLCEAMLQSSGSVTLGFNRPQSRIGRAIKSALDSQLGPSMYNWFIAGHEIEPDHWYFKEEEGGRVLGNLCHWTDFIYQMVPPESRYPIEIRPTRSHTADCDIAVTYTFGDGSIAVITFSAKGHTFEGVREVFAAHRGNVLIAMNDFKRAVIEEVHRKQVVGTLFRDHGHEAAIRRSYEMVRPALAVRADKSSLASNVAYVWETGALFLKTKQALETNGAVVVHPYSGLSRQEGVVGQ